jgi:hypothetical protein
MIWTSADNRRLFKLQPSFLERYIAIVANDDMVHHFDPQQLPRLNTVARDEDILIIYMENIAILEL